MSVAVEPSVGRPDLASQARHWAQRNSWTLALLDCSVILLITYLIQPSYGAAELEGLAIGAMPLAMAAVAQAIVVIAGGIDLSIGSMMALTSVTAAILIKNQPEASVPIVIGVLVLGLILGIINGTLVVITHVPDIVVTLAMSFVWAGAALVVLHTPGGASADWLTGIVSGSIGSEWIPRAFVTLLVIVGVIWIPLRRSSAGLAMYGIGSNRLAAFRSGVPVGRTKVFAYMLGGVLGIRWPGPDRDDQHRPRSRGRTRYSAWRPSSSAASARGWPRWCCRTDRGGVRASPGRTDLTSRREFEPVDRGPGTILIGVVMFGGLFDAAGTG
jgi:ABC-type xylose transport system permease subunit